MERHDVSFHAYEKQEDFIFIIRFRNELKMEISSIFGINNYGIVANKPPLNHSDSRKV